MRDRLSGRLRTRGVYWSAVLVGILLVCTLGLANARENPQSDDAADQPGRGHVARIRHPYQVPDITLRDRHDRPVKLRSLLDGSQPVVLQFIFTSCQTVCPMLTSMMAQAQDSLRDVDPSTRLVSISLDPDYDTPSRMAKYADKFGARGDWRFLTGDWKDIRRTLNAFDAMYPGENKMNHKPLTFMRAAGADQWVRLTGTMSAGTLLAQYRKTLN